MSSGGGGGGGGGGGRDSHSPKDAFFVFNEIFSRPVLNPYPVIKFLLCFPLQFIHPSPPPPAPPTKISLDYPSPGCKIIISVHEAFSIPSAATDGFRSVYSAPERNQ